ncbi:MAG TPA: hypothetical protein VF458_09100 [Ktedonobacteraceae bacterium]
MFWLSLSLTLAEFQPEDEVDTLFHHLPQIEPSGELITRILTRVRRLPGPLWQQDELELPKSSGIDALVVRNEKRDPS